MSSCDQRKGGRGSRRRREGHLNNIPFIHRTKQTSTESLLRLEVGSMGKGRNRWGTGVSLKKIQAPPNRGSWWGGELGLFQPKRNQDQKQFGKARTVRGGGRKKVQGVGVGGLFGNWGEGTALPLLGSPQPLRSGRKGAACNPRGQVWGCQMLQAGGWRGLTKACPPGR